MYRLRARKTQKIKADSDDTEEDNIPVKKNRKRVVASRKSKKVASLDEVKNGNEYDADSENELRKVGLDFLQIRSDSDASCEDEIKKRKDEFTNILSKFVTPIAGAKPLKKSNHLNHSESEIENTHNGILSNRSMSIDFTMESMDIEKSKKTLFVKKSKNDHFKSRKRKSASIHPLEKENITPPDQSTPAVIERNCTQQLDESLFGFNDITCKTPESPNRDGKTFDDESTSKVLFTSMQTYSKLSPLKRKKPDVDKSGFYDIPNEMPRKKTKRKKEKNVEENNEYLEHLRKQFKEIEMHELVIE